MWLILNIHTVSTYLTLFPLDVSVFVSADVGFEIPNRFVVGYALDYNEYFRDLNVSPELYFLHCSARDP